MKRVKKITPSRKFPKLDDLEFDAKGSGIKGFHDNLIITARETANGPAPTLLVRKPPKNVTLYRFVKWYFDEFMPATYRGDDGTIQCNGTRARTLKDIHKLCLSYYPKATVEQVATILINLMNKNHIGAILCSTAKDITFWNLDKCYSNLKNENPDDSDYDYKYKTQPYAFNEIIKMSGVKLINEYESDEEW